MIEGLLLFWGRVGHNLLVIIMRAAVLPPVGGRVDRNLPVMSAFKIMTEGLLLFWGRAAHSLPVIAM